MDYLITEGYPLAAKCLAAEANMPPISDFESINERVEIRDSIHRGDLQTAIEKINELNPQVRLHCSLVSLVILAMIRTMFLMHHSYVLRDQDENQHQLLQSSV